MFKKDGGKLVTVYNGETKDKKTFRLESFRESKKLEEMKVDYLAFSFNERL
jgi:hypothetical protein